MLPNLSDKASIGKNMAVALITTLYGAIMANFLLLPWAGRLDLYNKYDVITKEIILEGVLSIQAGDNPAVLREKLHSYLAPALRPKHNADGGV
jgi:chemotaxis protein MotA